jgi:hypothetical protein
LDLGACRCDSNLFEADFDEQCVDFTRFIRPTCPLIDIELIMQKGG